MSKSNKLMKAQFNPCLFNICYKILFPLIDQHAVYKQVCVCPHQVWALCVRTNQICARLSVCARAPPTVVPPQWRDSRVEFVYKGYAGICGSQWFQCTNKKPFVFTHNFQCLSILIWNGVLCNTYWAMLYCNFIELGAFKILFPKPNVKYLWG